MNELQLPYDSGLTLYAHVLNASGQRWNGSAFETYNEANWTTYDVALTEQGASGLYVGNFPSVAAGLYSAVVYQQQGGSPAVTDAPPVGSGTIDWTGAAVASSGAVVEPYVTGTVNDLFATAALFTVAGADLSGVDDDYNESWLAFTDGSLQGIARKITTYTAGRVAFTGTGTADDAPFPSAPLTGDAFVIVGHG
jgi:hypothetical protein